MSLFLSICITERSFLRKNMSIFEVRKQSSTIFEALFEVRPITFEERKQLICIYFLYTHMYIYIYIHIFRCIYIHTYIYIDRNTYTRSIYTLTLLFLFPLKGQCVSQHPEPFKKNIGLDVTFMPVLAGPRFLLLKVLMTLKP